MDELKSCPWCGSADVTADNEDAYGILCNMCGFCWSFDGYGNYDVIRAETITRWNTRPIEDALRAELDAANARIARLERILRAVDMRLWDVVVPMTNVPAGDYPDLADLTLAIRESAERAPTHYMLPASDMAQISAVIVKATACEAEDMPHD